MTIQYAQGRRPRNGRTQKPATDVEQIAEPAHAQNHLSVPISGLLRWTDRPTPLVQRATGQGGDPLGGTTVDPGIIASLRSRSGSGSPLPNRLAESVGAALGADLSTVRVHADQEADTISRSLQAKAFTHGTDVYFTGGTYAPNSSAGQHLLVHELAHVSQNLSSAASGPGGVTPTIGRAIDPAEAAADSTAHRVLAALRRNTDPSALWARERDTASTIGTGTLSALRRYATRPSSDTGIPTIAPTPSSFSGLQYLRARPETRAAGSGVIRRVLAGVTATEVKQIPQEVRLHDYLQESISPAKAEKYMQAIYNVRVAGGKKNTTKAALIEIAPWLNKNGYKPLGAFSTKLAGTLVMTEVEALKPKASPVVRIRELAEFTASGDAASLAESWNGVAGVAVDPALLSAIMTSNATLNFALSLTAAQKLAVNVATIESCVMPSTEKWVELRKRSLLAMTSKDKSSLKKRWPDEAKRVAALVDQEHFSWAYELTPEQFEAMTASMITNRQLPGKKTLAKSAAASRKTAEQTEQAANQKAKEERQAAGKAGRENAAARQTEAAAAQAAASAAYEATFREAITTVKAEFPNLLGSTRGDVPNTLGEIEAAIRTEQTQPAQILAVLRQRAADAYRLQLNPDDATFKATWARWLQLRLRDDAGVRFEPFGQFGGLDAHLSVGRESMFKPPEVTDRTSALELLNALFGAARPYVFTRVHVTLKTNAVDQQGAAAHPHRQWGYPVNPGPDLQTDPDDNGRLWRWNQHRAPHPGPLPGEAALNQAQITTALNAAYGQVVTALTARATTALGHHGRLPRPTR